MCTHAADRRSRTLLLINGYDSVLPYHPTPTDHQLSVNLSTVPNDIKARLLLKHPLSKLPPVLKAARDEDAAGVGRAMDKNKNTKVPMGYARKPNNAQNDKPTMYGSLPSVVSQQYVSNYKASLRDKATKLKSMFGGAKPKLRRPPVDYDSDIESLLDPQEQSRPNDANARGPLLKQFRNAMKTDPTTRFKAPKHRSGAFSDTDSVYSTHSHSSPKRCWVTPFQNDVAATSTSNNPSVHLKPARNSVQPARPYTPSVAASKSSTTWDFDQASSVPESFIDTDMDYMVTRKQHRRVKRRRNKKLGEVIGTKKMVELIERQAPIKVENLIGYRHNQSS